MFTRHTSLAIVVIASYVVLTEGVSSEGQPCYHITKNLNGTCRLLIDCNSALQEVQNQILPQICGLAETSPIVCCAHEPVGYKSRAKCREYSKFEEGKCYIRNKGTYNTSGIVLANGKEFPHLGILVYSGEGIVGRKYQCVGSLISERFVLTVAHCTNAIHLGQVKYVRLGDLDLLAYEDDAQPQEIKVVEIIRHPNYKPPSRYDDIALLKLERNVEITSHVRPACLHVDKELQETVGLIHAGWGQVDFGGDMSQQMRRLLLKTVSHEMCTKHFPENRRLPKGVVDDQMLCAVSDPPTCYGESGGPIQIQHPNVTCMYDVIALLAFGKACGIQDVPEVFFRVSHYIEWIESIVWP